MATVLLALGACIRIPERCYRTVGFNDPLCPVTIVDKEQGECWSTDVKLLAGSAFFEGHIDYYMREGRQGREKREGILQMLSLARRIGAYQDSMYKSYETLKERGVLEEFGTREEYERVKRLVSEEVILLSLPGVPFSSIKTVLSMSNVHYEDAGYPAFSLDEFYELLNVFEMLTFDDAVKAGLKIKGSESSRVDVWISKRMMFSINIAKALSETGRLEIVQELLRGGKDLELEKVRETKVVLEEDLGEAEVKEKLLNIKAMLERIPHVGEFLRTISIKIIERIGMEDISTLPVVVWNVPQWDGLPILEVATRKFPTFSLPSVFFHYLEKADSAGTFQIQELRVFLYEREDGYTIRDVGKACEMFPYVEKISFGYVGYRDIEYPRPHSTFKVFSKKRSGNILTETFETVLAQLEKYPNIEELSISDPKNILEEWHFEKLKDFPLKTLDLDLDNHKIIRALFKKGTKLASSVTNVSIRYATLLREYSVIWKLMNLRVVKIIGRLRTMADSHADGADLPDPKIKPSKARRIERLVFVRKTWGSGQWNRSRQVVRNVLNVWQPASIDAMGEPPISHALLELLGDGELSALADDLKEVCLTLQLSMLKKRNEGMRQGLKSLLGMKLKRVGMLFVMGGARNLIPPRGRERERFLCPDAEKVCLGVIKEVIDGERKGRVEEIKLVVKLCFQIQEPVVIPEEHVLQYFAEELAETTEEEKKAFVKKVLGYVKQKR